MLGQIRTLWLEAHEGDVGRDVQVNSSPQKFFFHPSGLVSEMYRLHP